VAADRFDTRDAVRSLRSGGVLLLATDTLPGLHCRADDDTAVRRIFDIKGRSPRKALLLLAGSLNQAETLTGPLTSDQAAACRRCWPGPFSLILPAGSLAAPAVRGREPTIAVRVPDMAPLRELILAVGVPLVSTSANRTGAAPAPNLTAAERDLGAEVDGVWGADHPDGIVPVPSALVNLTVAPFRVLRRGPKAFPGT